MSMPTGQSANWAGPPGPVAPGQRANWTVPPQPLGPQSPGLQSPGAQSPEPPSPGPVPPGPMQQGPAQQGPVHQGQVHQQGQGRAGSWPAGHGPVGQGAGPVAVPAQLPGASAGTVAPGWTGPAAAPIPPAPGPLGAASSVQQPAGPPPVPAPPGGGSFAAASRRTGFLTLVLVELRKLTGTLSDRILLALAPIVLIGVTVLIHTGSDYASAYASAAGQISPTFYTVRVGHLLLHAVLIKLIAGEWQHRSAQPTLLAQPSRARYFLAQATVVLLLWLLAAVLQLVTTLLVAPGAISGVGATYLLGYRPGWVIGVCVLGSLLTILVALTVAMLVPNAAGALAIYFATVPVMLTISGLAPQVFAWVDPSSATAALATLAAVDGPAPVIVSLLLWAGLLGLAGYRVACRDLA